MTNGWKIYFNPACSKCREARALLEGCELELVEYLRQPPTEAELLGLMKILLDPPSALVRTKDSGFQARPFPLTDPAVVARELAARPELLERPVVIKGGRAIVARPAARLYELERK